jgi:hypothetical protein
MLNEIKNIVMSNTTYKLDNSLKVTHKNNSFIDAGIHENISLVDVKADASPKGNKFLAFTFENAAGEKLTHTEWEPTKGKVKSDVVDPDEIKKQEALYDIYFNNKMQSQMKRVYAIATTFIPEDMFVFEAKNFEEFAKRVAFLLSNRPASKKIRIKVVYADNGFTSLPTYTKFPWIESMDIPTEKSLIKILSIDKMTRDSLRDKEKPTEGPDSLLDTIVSTKKNDDLPF